MCWGQSSHMWLAKPTGLQSDYKKRNKWNRNLCLMVRTVNLPSLLNLCVMTRTVNLPSAFICGQQWNQVICGQCPSQGICSYPNKQGNKLLTRGLIKMTCQSATSMLCYDKKCQVKSDATQSSHMWSVPKTASNQIGTQPEIIRNIEHSTSKCCQPSVSTKVSPVPDSRNYKNNLTIVILDVPRCNLHRRGHELREDVI